MKQRLLVIALAIVLFVWLLSHVGIRFNWFPAGAGAFAGEQTSLDFALWWREQSVVTYCFSYGADGNIDLAISLFNWSWATSGAPPA